MNNEPPQWHDPWEDPDPLADKKSPAIALLVAFLPTAIILIVRMVQPNVTHKLLFLLCGVSVLCCFISSGLLFGRRTGLSIVAGVIFLILNGLIAFVTGCLALEPH